jgi:hypothetical protein
MIRTRVVSNALKAYRERRTPQVKAIQRETQTYIVTYERAICPVLSGALQSTVEPVEDGDTRKVVVGGEVAPYAKYVNEGTDRQAANPFHDEAAQAGRRYQEEEYRNLK